MKFFLIIAVFFLMLVPRVTTAQDIGPNIFFHNQTISSDVKDFAVVSFAVVNNLPADFSISKVILTTTNAIPSGLTNFRIIDSALDGSGQQVTSPFSPSIKMEETLNNVIIPEGSGSAFYVICDYAKTTDNNIDTLTFNVQVFGKIGVYPVSLPIVRLQTLTIDNSNSAILPENEIDTHVSVYPNPFSSSTTVEYMLSKRSLVQISLFNPSGKEFEIKSVETQNQGDYRIDISNNDYKLPSGIYFLRFAVDDQCITRTLVKY